MTNSEPLLMFFEQHIVPFLEAKQISGMSLASGKRADAMFRDLKTSLDPKAHPVVDSLDDLCDQRRQFARRPGSTPGSTAGSSCTYPSRSPCSC